MAALSLTSKALHRLGCFFIGTPTSLGMPVDFYCEKGDRKVPTVSEIQQFKIQRNRLFADMVRRDLRVRVGVLTSGVTLAGCIGVLILAAVIGFSGRQLKSLSTPADQTQQTPVANPYPNLKPFNYNGAH